jgi:hypothetical protein
MSEPSCFNIEEAIEQASKIAPDVPLLALGQTVFWDEPMKATVALAAAKKSVRFVAGVHDTDYFAKAPGAKSGSRGYKTLPHNDGSTRGLWSAAAEFSVLFGSETVITKEQLVKYGLRFERLSKAKANFLDDATEAWGWRGMVSLSDTPPITLEVDSDSVVKELCNTLRWALTNSAESIGGDQSQAFAIADRINTVLCDAAEQDGQSLASVYRQILPDMYELVATQPVPLELTQTSELLRFNSDTCTKRRFDLLGRYVANGTREEACDAYNEAIKGYAGLYELSRFGTGAIPFDIVIPGHGRGTIRLGNRGAVFMTPKPQFLSFKQPISSLEEFANVLEAKFGPNCAIIGKAVTLIGMVGTEFIFTFHEGASNYVKVSRKLHNLLGHKVHPILRVRYHTWDSLSDVCNWLKLPLPFQRAFGSEDVCTPSFAARWQAVGEEQQVLLQKLSTLRKPMDLLHFIEESVGGAWKTQAAEYQSLHQHLGELSAKVTDLKKQRQEAYGRLRSIRKEQQNIQSQMGDHFRSQIFEQEPSKKALDERDAFRYKIDGLGRERIEMREKLFHLGQSERQAAQDPEVTKAHRRRREIELEAELKRLRMIREAVISSDGLQNANRRPSGWWLPLVSPDGSWFQKIAATAECYWEPMN